MGGGPGLAPSRCRRLPRAHRLVPLRLDRHEIAHLALDLAAGQQPLPRWFHEGVAISVDAGWRLPHQTRLLFEIARGPAVGDVETLFGSDAQHETARAYLLAAVLVADLRERHGAALPGIIARRTATGVPFDRAFALETGDAPEAAAARAWAFYLRWTTWIPALTSASALWLVILVVAAAAFVARRRRRARIRRRWEEEEALEKAAAHAGEGPESRG